MSGRVVRVDGRDAAEQMAIDEALARTPQRGPVLRLYRWARPAVSYGYFMDAETARQGRIGWDAVRRPTGGGLVEHGEDVTYTLVLPRDGACSTVAQAFDAAHQLVFTALRMLAIPARMASAAAPAAPGACATQPVTGDALVDGAKVAGAAARRLREAVLVQGYVALDRLPSVSWTRLAEAMETAAVAQWPVAWRADGLTTAEQALADELAERRYRNQKCQTLFGASRAVPRTAPRARTRSAEE